MSSVIPIPACILQAFLNSCLQIYVLGIQEIMGHADITTTMDIYNEATLDKKKESFANLEGKIKLS